jgi:hypothetical protein
VRFKDLQDVLRRKLTDAAGSSHQSAPPFFLDTRAFRATEFSDWISLTLQIQQRDLVWKQEDGKTSAHLRIFAEITSLTGRNVATIEYEARKSDDSASPSPLKDGVWQTSRWFALPVVRYRIDVVVQDVNSGKTESRSRGIFAPGFYRDRLEISSLVIADEVDIPHLRFAYPTSGELFVGDVRIHTRALETFHSDEQMYAFTQAYNLAVDPNTGKSDAAISYTLTEITTGRVALESRDPRSNSRGNGEQVTFWPAIPLKNIPSGDYRVCVTVNDRIGHRTSASSTSVRIE